MGNRLKVERAINDLTQAQLAELIGVSRQTINAIEKGKYIPSTLLALKMAKVFNKPVEEFFFLDDNEWAKEV
jgi:putative transcriptional regulator